MGKVKEKYYYIYETFGNDQVGDDEEVTHKYFDSYRAIYAFFNGYLKEYSGWVQTFREGDTYFGLYVRDRFDNEDAEQWAWIQLKKWKGWEKEFRIIYKLSHKKEGSEKTEYFLNQKELIERIERFEHKNIYLWQPQGWGTPISVYARTDMKYSSSYERPWENNPIEGYEIEYIFCKDFPNWEHHYDYTKEETPQQDDDENAPKVVKKNPKLVLNEDDESELPF